MAFGSELGAVGFGIAASLSWGTSDFSGGLASKRASVYGVILISNVVGLALLLALALAWGEAWPSRSDMIWGMASGLVGSLALLTFYRALSVGQMGLVAPVGAVVGTAIPVLFSVAIVGLPRPAQMLGFAVAIVSVWLIARAPGKTLRPAGLGLAIGAGIGFGVFFILVDQISADSVFWPLVGARGASFAVVLSITLARRQPWMPSRAALPIIVLAGLLDVGGNVFFLLATQAGRLDVASVLSSLYPAVTVLLARMILDERLSRAQSVGIATALAAIPLIAG
jgi:drug/metabolite transporter (DMT)-like permease